MSWETTLFLLIPVVIGAAAIWAALGIRAEEADYASEGVRATGVVVDKRLDTALAAVRRYRAVSVPAAATPMLAPT